MATVRYGQCIFAPSDKWIDGFSMGVVCFDTDAKELVKVSNGQCAKDHAVEFHVSHPDGQCIFAPSEAIAIRPLRIDSQGRITTGWTYRKVRSESLAPCDNVAAGFFEAILANAKGGRV